MSGIELAAELPFGAIRLVGKTKCSSCFTFSYLLARVGQKYKMISVCNLIFTRAFRVIRVLGALLMNMKANSGEVEIPACN